jgi:hypothetical protein
MNSYFEAGVWHDIEVWDGTTYLEMDGSFGFTFLARPSALSYKNAPVVGNGTYNPIGFTREELCLLYWRIKSFKITGNYKAGSYYPLDLVFSDFYKSHELYRNEEKNNPQLNCCSVIELNAWLSADYYIDEYGLVEKTVEGDTGTATAKFGEEGSPANGDVSFSVGVDFFKFSNMFFVRQQDCITPAYTCGEITEHITNGIMARHHRDGAPAMRATPLRGR